MTNYSKQGSQVSKKCTFITSSAFEWALPLWMYSNTGLWPGNSSGLSLRQLSSATFTPESASSSAKYRPGPRRMVITCDPSNFGFANVFTYPKTAILRSSDRQSVLHRRRKRSARVTWQRSRRSLATCQIVQPTARNLGSCIFDKGGKIRGPFWKHAVRQVPGRFCHENSTYFKYWFKTLKKHQFKHLL